MDLWLGENSFGEAGMTDTQRFSDLPVAAAVTAGDYVLGLAGGAPSLRWPA